MNTKIVQINPHSFTPAALAEAAELLRAGKLVAFPTETVYGLGANANDPAAVAAIFTAKGRPSDNPLIVHVADEEEVAQIAAEIPPVAITLFRRFWPGPLTVVLPAKRTVPTEVTAGLPTVAVRLPSHPVARELIRLSGVPVAAPSANRSGRPSPTLASHVWEDLAGRIAMIVDGGPTGVGVESTVVDVTSNRIVILRPGGVTLEELQEIDPKTALDPALGFAPGQTPKAPGLKYTHYAPKAPVVVYEGTPRSIQEAIRQTAAAETAQGKKVGILATAENAPAYTAGEVLVAGSRCDLTTVAAALYDALRRFDELQVDLILAEGVPEEGIGLAVMNRLRKAAGGNVVQA